MQTKLLINGQLVAGEGAAQPVFNPALGRVLVEINEASEAQVDAAVRAADAAFDSWSQTPPKERAHLLLKLADIYDKQTQSTLKRFMAALVPMLTLIMTGLVAIIMLAIMLPLMSLTSNI